MNPVELLSKKRNGNNLTREEMEYFIGNYISGTLPDYQMSAMLMAFCIGGMSWEEIATLTEMMVKSGKILDLKSIEGIKVDKHSSGGVGDKISLIVCPICAACGIPVAKMSGRGLGFTGGTVDKLEAIPGFRTEITSEEFIDGVKKHGICIMAQSEEIAKADKMLYALRDVTGTVQSEGLIISSIMSKKIATGADAVLLDVKYGKGALMKDQAAATSLGKGMQHIGDMFGIKVEYVISDMNEPLGNRIGNLCEVMEAIELLKGKGPEDLRVLSEDIAGRMIWLGGVTDSVEEGKRIAKEIIESGKALDKFREWIEYQGADVKIIDNFELLPRPENIVKIYADNVGEGTICSISADIVGTAASIAGAGRIKKSDIIDKTAGITLCFKKGDIVKKGDILAYIYGKSFEKVEEAAKILTKAYAIK